MSMIVKLHDTLSRNLQPVEHKPEPLKVYTCGLTVYARAHIGNWRAYIFNDMLVRTLSEAGYQVERAMNHTDVGHLVSDDDEGEDKLQKAATKQRKSAWDIAEEYIELFESDLREFNMVWPEHLVRATDTIEQQIDFVKKLEASGYTYIIDDGVYFDTSKLGDYGKLAQLQLDKLREGARVAANPQKRNPTDFAVWKFSPIDSKRDMEWDSPWGQGFPGWHLECSVIAEETLGPHLDIHTGGVDHIAVHHTNEIAQSEAIHGAPFSKIWLHIEHLHVNSEKMAKSLGNGYTLDDVKQQGFNAMDVRLFVLQSHYRTQANFTWDILQDAHNRLKRYYRLAEVYMFQFAEGETAAQEKGYIRLFNDKQQMILDAIADDLNTPRALSILDEIPNLPDKFSKEVAKRATEFFEFIDRIFGLDITKRVKDLSPEQNALLQEQIKAKQNKDYERADKIKLEELPALGIQVNEGKDRTTWGRIELRD